MHVHYAQYIFRNRNSLTVRRIDRILRRVIATANNNIVARHQQNHVGQTRWLWRFSGSSMSNVAVMDTAGDAAFDFVATEYSLQDRDACGSRGFAGTPHSSSVSNIAMFLSTFMSRYGASFDRDVRVWKLQPNTKAQAQTAVHASLQPVIRASVQWRGWETRRD